MQPRLAVWVLCVSSIAAACEDDIAAVSAEAGGKDDLPDAARGPSARIFQAQRGARTRCT
jgi:hypothetical protein